MPGGDLTAITEEILRQPTMGGKSRRGKSALSNNKSLMDSPPKSNSMSPVKI